MNNQTLVSIVTPSYNTGKYIRDTIESVLSQGYPNFEHIIYDGGSTDETIDILKEYPHLIWFSESDRGQSHAINKGLNKAKGDIIGWLNSDDTYNSGTIKTAVEYFNNHPEIDLIHTDCNIIDKTNNFIRSCQASEFDLNKLLFSNNIQQMTVFLMKNVFDKIGAMDEDLHYTMDRELWLRIILKKNMRTKYIAGETFANFRFIEGTKCFSTGHKVVDEWFVVLNRLATDYYDTSIDRKILDAAIQNNKSRYHLALLRNSRVEGNTLNSLKNILNAVKYDFSLLLNSSIYFLIVEAVVGKKLAESIKGFVK
jgi:glycosyltransferase involved in cell wall biosynthesis